MHKNRRVLFPKIFYPLILVVGAILYSAINAYQYNRGVRFEVKWPVDDLIPLCTPFIVPYVYWFVYIALAVVILFCADTKEYERMLLSCGLTMAVSCVVFLVYPTYISRPEILGDGFFDRCVGLLYALDHSCNGLPSVHVGYSVVLCFHLFIVRKHSPLFHVFNFGSCLLICASTLLTKQHYVPDLVWGFAVGLSASVLLRLLLRDRPKAPLRDKKTMSSEV